MCDCLADLIEVRVGDSIIASTFHHPVWVVEGKDLAKRPRPDHVAEALEPLSAVFGRWVDLGDLQVGDVVLLQADREARIEAITVRPACAKVYNFEVEELHNYAVGADRVLVHNATPCGAAIVKMGQAGEAAARIVKNTTRIPSHSGRVAFRIPDELTKTAVTEVKNQAFVEFRSQIRDSLHYAIEQGKEFVLVVRTNTRLSQDLQRAVDAGWITLRRII